MAEMLSVINAQWDRLFLLGLTVELYYTGHFFAVYIIFYKQRENWEKIIIWEQRCSEYL